ncbi:MAG: GGDEF domain-containing protein [Acidimicrobiales bacterium]
MANQTRDTSGAERAVSDERFPPRRTRPVGPDPFDRSEAEKLTAIERHRVVEAALAGPVGLMVVDESWRCLFANRAAAALVGRRPADLGGVSWANFVAGRDVAGVVDALRTVRRTGERTVVAHRVEPFYAEDRAVELAIVAMDPDHNAMPRFSVALTDVSVRRRRERRLSDRAHFDALTGLPNRASTVEYIADAVRRRRSGEAVVVTFVDLDGFKPVNETHGHPAGDEVLCAVARRLRLAQADGELIGRVGGDEFVGCCTPGRADPGGLAHRILRSLAEPIAIAEGRQASIGASIGVAVADDLHADLTAEELIGRADTAMYSAKRLGGGRFVLFEAADLLHGPGFGGPGAR